MKKIQKPVVCSLMLFLAVMFILPVTAEAAKKNKVKATVKNGVLTISGKGEMPVGMKFKNPEKIKKVVVKKGITLVPALAFESLKQATDIRIAKSVQKIGEYALPDSKKLKKVTLPGTFKVEFSSNVRDWDIWSYRVVREETHIDTIRFISKLSLETLAYVRSNNLVVRDNDPNYKSVDGVIYSKDGKSLVRVPALRESLTVENGCEEFCTQAVVYATTEDVADVDEFEELQCKNLKTIVLPATIRRVDTKKYYAFNEAGYKSKVEKIQMPSGRLKDDAIKKLLSCFEKLKKKEFLRQFD